MLLLISGVIFTSCATWDTSTLDDLRAYDVSIELSADPLIVKRYDSTTVYWGSSDSVALERLAVKLGVEVGLLQGERKFAPMADTTFYADFLADIHPMLKEMVGELFVKVQVIEPDAPRASNEARQGDRRIVRKSKPSSTSPSVTEGPSITPEPQAPKTPDLEQCKQWKIQFLNAWIAGEESFREFAYSNQDNPFAKDAIQILKEGRYSHALIDDSRDIVRHDKWIDNTQGWPGNTRSWIGYSQEWNDKAEHADISLHLRAVECEDNGVGTLYFDARNFSTGPHSPQLFQHELELMENGRLVEILSVERMYHGVKAPADFVFVIDGTEGMRPYISALMHDIHFFARSLSNSGIDFRLGLVVYGDAVRSSWGMTSSAYEFSETLSRVYPYGGRNEAESALEAVAIAMNLPFRQNAFKNIVVLSDEGFHYPQNAASLTGRTRFTPQNMIALLNRKNVALNVLSPGSHSVDGGISLDYDAIEASCLNGTGIDLAAMIHSKSSPSYSALTSGTGGHLFSIPSTSRQVDLRGVFSEFHGNLTQSLYRLRYRRNVRWSHSSLDLMLRLRSAHSGIFVHETWDCKPRFSVSDIYFPIGKYGRDDIINHQDLRDIAYTLRENPEMKISLEGYTCDVNTREFNFDLSWQRLRTIENYLRMYCHPSQIRVSTGFGEHKFVQGLDNYDGMWRGDHASDWSRHMNRCVRIGLIENDIDPDAYPQIDRPRGNFKFTVKLLNPWYEYDESGRRYPFDAFKKLESTYAGRQFFDRGTPCFGGFYREADAYSFIRKVLKGPYRQDFPYGQFIVTKMLP